MERTRAAYCSPNKQQLIMETYEEVKDLIAYMKKVTQSLLVSLKKKPGRQYRKVRKIFTDLNFGDQ